MPLLKQIVVLALAMTTPLAMTTSSGRSVRPKQSSASSNASERTVEGVWRTVVTPRNCQTGQPLGPFVIRGLSTFHDGGTMSEFGVAPG